MRALFCYLHHGIAGVEGWLSPTAAAMIAELLVRQSEDGLRGDLCEIGVHHGKLFLVLANAAAAGERSVAVDVFDDQEKNIDRSGLGVRAVFEAHAAAFAPGADIEIVQESSLDLERIGFASRRRFRFISIDGGHTRQVVANDLRIAERTLVGGGAAALDDILSAHWTGVLSGLAEYLSAGGTLAPVALIPNKLLLAADADAASRLRALMRRHFPSALAKPGLEFLGHEVDSYDDHPFYDLGAHAGLRWELERLRGERDALLVRLDAALARAEDRDARDAAARREASAAEEARAALARVHASTSWRITAPLRRAAAALRG